MPSLINKTNIYVTILINVITSYRLNYICTLENIYYPDKLF